MMVMTKIMTNTACARVFRFVRSRMHEGGKTFAAPRVAQNELFTRFHGPTFSHPLNVPRDFKGAHELTPRVTSRSVLS